MLPSYRRKSSIAFKISSSRRSSSRVYCENLIVVSLMTWMSLRISIHIVILAELASLRLQLADCYLL